MSVAYPEAVLRAVNWLLAIFRAVDFARTQTHNLFGRSPSPSPMIPANERQEFLSTIPIFAGLNESALSELVKVAEEVSIDDRQVIVREGEAGNRMFIIHTGRVEVVKYLGEPKETILAVLGSRDFLGEMSMIECVKRSASLRAAEPAFLFSLKGTDLYHL